jgi:hypothetical protein
MLTFAVSGGVVALLLTRDSRRWLLTS